jgi:AAA family ATP:ADP antiporter
MKVLFLTAGLLMAHQGIGSTVRDALFLVYFGPTALPLIKFTAALFSIAMGLSVPRLFQRYDIGRAIPAAFVLSGLLHFLEFTLRDVSPKAASVAVYLHVVSFSAILISSFWLLLTERFDPGEGRRWFARIAGYSTIGGIIGSLLTAVWPSSGSSKLGLVFVMGVFHVVCGVAILLFCRRTDSESARVRVPFLSPLGALSSAPYLRALALLVFLGTMSAGLLDIRFQSAASHAYRSVGELFGFFAVFRTANQILCFLLQTFLVRYALERFSLGANIGALPAVVTLGSFGSALFPGLGVLAAARGAESVVRGSVFRTGYDTFYIPMPAAEKRAAKGLIDVVFDRLGEAAAAGVLLLAPAGAALSPAVPVIGGCIAVAGIFLSVRLGRGYSHVVHRGLTQRAEQINEHLSRYGDWSLDTILLETVHTPAAPPPPDSTPLPQGPSLPAPPLDETTRRFAALRSGDPARVRQTLAALQPPDPVLVPALIELLGWSEVWKETRTALVRAGARHIGQFVDALSDPSTDFSIRRRLPSVLAACGGARAAAGLAAALEDIRFEIRLHSARSLDVLVCADPSLCPPRSVIGAAIARELSVSPQLWQIRAVIDDQASSPVTGFRDASGAPADYRLELLFSLFALEHEREPLRAAFRALHTADKVIFSLGLEYVDSLLPPDLRQRFRSLVAEGVPDTSLRPKRTREEVASILLASQPPEDSPPPSGSS